MTWSDAVSSLHEAGGTTLRVGPSGSRAALLAAVALALTPPWLGCDPNDPGSDGGQGRIELGTGTVGTFVPFDSGDTLRLARGCQGGQHVWISLRAWDLDVQPGIVQLSMLRERDGMVVSLGYQVRLRFDSEAGLEYDQVTGLGLVVPDPEAILGETAIIRARVTATDGRSASEEKTARIEWGDEVCGSFGDAGPPLRGDASAAVVGGAAEVELGTGSDGMFASVTDGETLELARGCQGSQHVWIALRCRSLDMSPGTVDLRLTRERDGTAVSLPFDARLRFDSQPEWGYSQVSGLTLVVPEPDQALDEDLILHGEATGRGGGFASAERHVRVVWGPETCP